MDGNVPRGVGLLPWYFLSWPYDYHNMKIENVDISAYIWTVLLPIFLHLLRVKRGSIEIPVFTGSQLLSPTSTNATFPLKRLKARIKRAHVLFESS